MRLGVEISELSDNELENVIERALEKSECGSCSFILKNNDKITKTVKKLLEKKSESQKEKFMLSASVFCENYFKVNEKREFKCGFSKNLNWESIENPELGENCPLCGSKLLISSFLMKIEGSNVQVICPVCFSPAQKARGVVKTF